MKLYLRNLLFKVAALTLFMASSAWAVAPSIISVTGSTIAPKAMLVFNGTNFGALAEPRPIAHGDFTTNIQVSTWSLKTTWDDNENLARTSVCNGLPNTPNCVYGIWQSSVTQRAFDFMVQNVNHYQAYYLYQKKYMSGNSSANQKFNRLWRLSTGGPNDWVTSTDAGGVCFNESETGDTPGINGVIGGYQGLVDFVGGVWNYERMIWTRTGLGTGKNNDGTITTGDTGTWDYMRNGVTLQHRENVRNYQDLLAELRIGDFTDGAHLNPDGTVVDYAGIYVSTVAYGVFLSTHNTWAAAQHDAAPQPMTLRTATAAVTYTDMTGLTPNVQYYGYIMGATTSDVNTTGFAITLTASNTNLHPTIGTITQTSIAFSWDNVSPNQLAVFSANSDYSSPISSGNMTTPQTYSNLTCNTQYYFEVKVATENDSGYAPTNAVTLSCSGPPAKMVLQGIGGRGWGIK